MDIQRVYKLSQHELNQIVDLHTNFLQESFLNNLGKEFLKISYVSIIKNKNFFFILRDKKQIIGFLVATKDSSKFSEIVIKENFLILLKAILKTCFYKPLVIYKLIAWFLFPPKSFKMIKPELQFFVIHPNFQRNGWGKKMVCKLQNEFKNANIMKYKVGTKANNPSSNNFYKKMNFTILGSELAFGDKFNYYQSPNF